MKASCGIVLGIMMAEGTYRLEAAACRTQAIAYVGLREVSFLLKVASVFDELADKQRDMPKRKSLWASSQPSIYTQIQRSRFQT